MEVAIHPEDLPRIPETFREALNSVKPYEVEGRFRRFDGAWNRLAITMRVEVGNYQPKAHPFSPTA